MLIRWQRLFLTAPVTAFRSFDIKNTGHNWLLLIYSDRNWAQVLNED